MTKPFLLEGGNLLGAQPFNVESVSRDEMLEPLDRLRRADQRSGAARDGIGTPRLRIDGPHRMFRSAVHRRSGINPFSSNRTDGNDVSTVARNHPRNDLTVDGIWPSNRLISD